MAVRAGWYAPRMRVRVLSVILAVAIPACFKELPSVPVGSEGSTGMGGTTEMPTGGIEPGLSSSGAAGTMISDSDIDMATTGSPPPPPDEGLFACNKPDCEVWVPPNCAKGCTLDPAGTCLFEQLRDRNHARGDVRLCGDACERTALVIRGGGTEEVQRQTATELGDGGLADYKNLKKCALRESAFFAGCLEMLTADCVDLAQWFTGCEDTPLGCGE